MRLLISDPHPTYYLLLFYNRLVFTLYSLSMQTPCQETQVYSLLTLLHFKTTEAHQLNNNNLRR